MLNQRVSDTDVSYYGVSRAPLLSLLTSVSGRVLEIGCGNGVTLELLKSRGATYACGFEVNPAAAALARARKGVDEVLVGDIEKEVAGFADSSFDIVLASHVLEHLVDPWRVAREIFRILRPGGRLIGAIPNVRHLSVLMPLVLKGDWEYADSGVLDWTHVRFFTRRGILAMLEKAGFLDIQLQADVLGGGKSAWLDRATFGALKDFAAYAYNFSGSKP